MNKLLSLIMICFSAILVAQNEVINLWSKEIPNAIENNDYKEVNEEALGRVSRVTMPTLTVFVPENPNGTAMIICPGGGYGRLAIDKEGYKIGEWLNTLGITAFVLKYRLPSDAIMKDKTIGPLQDAQESIRYVRRNAKKWHLNTEKIGVMGFSAGGHLASTLSTHYNDQVYKAADEISAKPSFSVLMYPVISMEENITHKGSKNKLLGNSPSKEIIENYSNEKQIDSLTPPTFLVHASNDETVPVENSILYYLALKNNYVSAEMHISKDGKHGFGLGVEGTNKDWTKHCESWLRSNKYIN